MFKHVLRVTFPHGDPLAIEKKEMPDDMDDDTVDG